MNKKTLILLLSFKAVLFIVFIITLFLPQTSSGPVVEEAVDVAEVTPMQPTIIGYSQNGLPLTVFEFGTGDSRLLLVGGIHGGYEWNTVALAEEVIAYYQDNRDKIPAGVVLSIIPNLNPDGLMRTFGTTSLMAADTAFA